MCSFLFSRTRNPVRQHLLNRVNVFAKRRGPDSTDVMRLVDPQGFHICCLHNLLDISGSAAKQPAVNITSGKKKVLMFNGEIYNYDAINYSSDTAYLTKIIGDSEWVSRLSSIDGEYAILIYDITENALVAASDCFLTKPMFFGFSSISQDFAISSYASMLQKIGLDKIEMARPNTIYKFSLADAGCVTEIMKEPFSFDINQYKKTYDAWINAFVTSVEKRAVHGAHKPFVCLSSGYDSGAICLALNLLNIDYETFSITSGEVVDILEQRIQKNKAGSCTKVHVWKGLSNWNAWRMRRDVRRNVEFFEYTHEDGPGYRKTIRKDEAALGLNFLAAHAASAGLKVCMSGAGADEIHSDYGILGEKIYYHSEFGGLFPDDLNGIFPWRKFYGDTQRSYLMKEEMVLGRHGIEGRYPFLDKKVVQEFLSLKVGLKNSVYKAPLACFLRQHDYPFEANRKRGFTSRAGLEL